MAFSQVAVAFSCALGTIATVQTRSQPGENATNFLNLD
jgi:hypothetical protein